MFWNSTIYPKQINHRVHQIHKEGGVVNRFLTARRHFWTPWSERTHCMGNGQPFFFYPASHALRACETRALRSRKTLMQRFTYFFTHFEKKKQQQQQQKKRLFCSLPLHGMEKFSFLGLPTLVTRCHFVNLTSFKIVSFLFSSSMSKRASKILSLNASQYTEFSGKTELKLRLPSYSNAKS